MKHRLIPLLLLFSALFSAAWPTAALAAFGPADVALSGAPFSLPNAPQGDSSAEEQAAGDTAVLMTAACILVGVLMLWASVAFSRLKFRLMTGGDKSPPPSDDNPPLRQ